MTSKDKEQDIKKAESHAGVAVPLARERGQPRIVTSSKLIQDSKKTELSPDNRLGTFDSMMADDAVYSAVNYTTLFIIKALVKGKAVPMKGSRVSEEAAKFLNYNLNNMEYGTWYQAVTNMATALPYGWSDLNIVMKPRKYGKYKGYRCLAKLSPRDQKSVYGWLWNESLTEWKGFVQKPSLKQTNKNTIPSRLNDGIYALANSKFYETNYPIVWADQLVHTAYNGTNNNPQGDSPLMHCYDAWYEKKLIENFELSGLSKDLNGLLVLRVPSELIEQANDPETYPDAAEELANLEQDASDMHIGKTTHVLLTSDVDDISKTYLYDLELKGITGSGGKNYITSQVIDQKRKAIYSTLGAQHLLLGQDGGGSYALSSTQSSAHGHIVSRDIMQFEDIINSQLLPRILAANGIYLNYDEMPVFKAGEPDELSLDEIGKFVQRVKSVNALTPEMWEYVAGKGGLPTDGIFDLDYMDTGASRSGDGMKTPGQGTSTKVGGGDSSVSNSENGGVSKQRTFVAEKGTDRIIDVETDECFNEHLLDKNGDYK